MVLPTLPLSVFLITKNEADRLATTLRAITGLSDDIVIVDSGSTDATVAIAEDHGARVQYNEWHGYGVQKRVAESLCRYQWVLNLDADEVVSPEFLTELRAIFREGPQYDAYETRMVEMFPFETKQHPLAFSMTAVRLYNRKKGTYSQSPVHDRVELSPTARYSKIKAPILHYSVKSLESQLSKLNTYTTMQVNEMAQSGRVIAPLRLCFEFPLAFLKAFVIRRYFLRGTYGFISAMNYAYIRHLRIAKHIEQRRGWLTQK